MDLQRVREGLARNAATVVSTPSLTAFAYPAEIIPEPCFFTAETLINFDQSYGRGSDEVTITCRVLIGRGDDRAAFTLLDSYLDGDGEHSLKRAIESEPTLGGVCDDVTVMRTQGYGYYTHGEKQYVGAELIVSVVGSGARP